MTEPLMIDGWTCRLVRGQRSAQNYTLEMGAWLMPDGRLKTTGAETDGSEVTVTVPASVLAWLVAPLIDRGWAQGHATGKRTALEADQPAPTETAADRLAILDSHICELLELLKYDGRENLVAAVALTGESLERYQERLAHALANPPGPRGAAVCTCPPLEEPRTLHHTTCPVRMAKAEPQGAPFAMPPELAYLDEPPSRKVCRVCGVPTGAVERCPRH